MLYTYFNQEIHIVVTLFILQCDLTKEEKEDLEFNIDDLDYVTDGEDELDDTTHLEVLRTLNILGGHLPAQTVDKDDANTIKNLLHGLTLAEKGHEMIAKGCSRIKTAVIQMPSLHKLGTILNDIKTTDPNIVLAANARSKLPQTQLHSLPSFYRPQGVKTDGKNRFRCAICEAEFGSWVGCDSHIRANHTHIKYGPCTFCSFTTTAYDSFQRHLSKCGGSN